MTDDTTVVVSSVPPPYRGRVANKSNELIAISLFVLQFALSLGATAAPAVVIVQLGFRFMPDSFAPVLVGLGVAGLAGWLLMGWVSRHSWAAWYMFTTSQREFSQRPDPIVAPDDRQAIFVEVIPRRNWGAGGLSTTEDYGFLLIDPEQRRVLFEGDQKRYQIPAAALIAVEIEFATPHNHRGGGVAVVVLQLRERDGLGERELCLCPRRTVSGDPLGTGWLERAQELQRRIQHILAGAVPAGV